MKIFTSRKRSLILILLLAPLAVFSQVQTGSLRGTIKTSDGAPGSFVNIALKGLRSTVVDKDGAYLIRGVRPGSYTLVASFIGLETQSRQIEITANGTTVIDLVLRENNQQLQEVVVNGNINKFTRNESDHVSKMPLKAIENPQVYSVVTKELLTEQLIFNVDDAIKNTPGVQKMWDATGRGGDGGSFFASRGFVVQSSLRNGLAGLVTNTMDAANLERLEVIKGPSATLFGSSLGSYGGIMNRVTKKPYEHFGGEVSLSGGSFDFHRISADINTPLSGDKKLLFRLNTAYNYESSFQDKGFAQNLAVAPSLSYKLNDRLSVNLDAEISRGKNIGKSILFFYFPASSLGANTAEGLNLDYNKSYIGDDLTQQSRSTNLFGQVNYKLSNSFTSSTNITSSHSFSNGFNPYLYLVPDDIATGNPDNAGKATHLTRADQSTGKSTNDIFEIQQNFNGDFKIGSLRNRIVLGLDYFHINADQNFFGSVYDVISLSASDFSGFNKTNMDNKYAAGAPDFTYPITGKTNTYSAFVSNVLNLTDQLSVLTALRVDHFENKGGSAGGAVVGYDQTTFSPKFGLVFQPVKDALSLFANYQNAFVNKGSYNAYNASAPATPILSSANPEQANQFEAGIKVDAAQGKVSGTVSYYNIKVSDMLRSDNRAPAIAQIQDGTQRSKGFEVELITNPARGLNIVAGFSYNDSEFEKADADVLGRRPSTASSPYLANLWLSYRIPVSNLNGLGIGFGGNYASENKIMNSVANGVFTLPSYTVLGATVFYDKPKYRIGFKADNLSSERYWIGYTTMSPQKPRGFTGSISYKF